MNDLPCAESEVRIGIDSTTGRLSWYTVVFSDSNGQENMCRTRQPVIHGGFTLSIDHRHHTFHHSKIVLTIALLGRKMYLFDFAEIHLSAFRYRCE